MCLEACHAQASQPIVLVPAAPDYRKRRATLSGRGGAWRMERGGEKHGAVRGAAQGSAGTRRTQKPQGSSHLPPPLLPATPGMLGEQSRAQHKDPISLATGATADGSFPCDASPRRAGRAGGVVGRGGVRRGYEAPWGFMSAASATGCCSSPTD